MYVIAHQNLPLYKVKYGWTTNINQAKIFQRKPLGKLRSIHNNPYRIYTNGAEYSPLEFVIKQITIIVN